MGLYVLFPICPDCSHILTFRRFQALLKTYEQLSNFVLDTIRLDLRCRAIHYLDSSMRNVSNQLFPYTNLKIDLFQGTYDSNYEPNEPDPYIADLNMELVQCDESMSIHLPKKEREYGQLRFN